MSQNFTPSFVYQRKKPRKNPVTISETEPEDGVKPHNGISQLSILRSVPQNFRLNFTYRRKTQPKDPNSISETELPDGVKHPNGVSHTSTSSTMSRNILPTFVYRRKRPCANPVSISETDLPNGISQLSTSSSMSRDSPTFVYRRKKGPTSIVEIKPPNGVKPSGGCQSSVSAFSISECAAEDEYPAVGPVKCSTVATVITDRYDNWDESGLGLALRSDMGRVSNANENCSSSKSNVELRSPSHKSNTDDAGECSSSGSLIGEKSAEGISARDMCILNLRSQGLLDRVWTKQNKDSNKNSSNYRSRPCRVCKHTESTQHMLICDHCEGAFHISCCNPRITVLPAGEWLCSSCLKKKLKKLKDKSGGNSTNISNKSGRNLCLASEGELGSVQYMFRDTEPYMSSVRIGDEFQASVPNWSGPANEECHLICDAMEMDPSDYVHIKKGDHIKALNLSSIGNWLQCRGVIEGVGEGVDGTVCAKWRRAPLFEVQTDDWECFDCVLWDPARADCAVPQELDTDEVMRQLRYTKMLRKRLAARRRKTG